MAALTVVTPPSGYPVLRNDAKLHMRVSNDQEDLLIDSLIVAATGICEQITRRALHTQTLRYSLDRWPSEILGGTNQRVMVRELPLPKPPLQSVTSVQYVDLDEVTQTLDAADYSVDSESFPARIVLKPGKVWPTLAAVPNAVKVTYVAGHGTDCCVPQAVKQAMLLIIGHLYENREMVAMSPGLVVAELPRGVNWLLSSYRVWDFGELFE